MRPRTGPLFPPELPPQSATPQRVHPTAAVRTFFAVALQLGRVFPSLIELIRAVERRDQRAMRRAASLIANAVLHGARDRGRGQHVRSVIDQQRRTKPLTGLRPSRSGRTPQAIAARRGAKVAA